MNIITRNIPNAITSLNLLSGIAGILCVFSGRLDISFLLMIAAAVFDFFDGLAARALGAYSPMGKELDSLADSVSFGLLPALMLHKLMIQLGEETTFWCYVPLVIALFSVLRLAKFNVDERQSENFIGLATPASAMICGSLTYYLLHQSDSFMIPLTRSMGLVLEEFYNTYLHNEVITRMRTVGVSSVTGEGMGDLETAIQEAKEEYFKVFLPMIQVGDGWLLKGRQIARRKQARKQRRR